ncbi:hypothetical protein BCR34DRAFT_637760 [Clohesyomyces aquaticus]|uniref:F-box domain-containing protein n=1 Tax=Clohesyomyces aquaticus TaxID=1231657 RepID=A0A1Y1YS97_9PLEO|nr:hypothetical protein BCR34DRAFT_637760 [Clohesyomyces aquaticus]
MMVSRPFTVLPTDVLVQIIIQLKRGSETNNDLLSCLRVSRRWYDSAMPVIHGNIVLHGRNLTKCLDQANMSRLSSCVRSATVRLEAHIWMPYPNSLLIRLNPLIGSLENLMSFSIGHANSNHRQVMGVYQETLVDLVLGLPASCIDLEIDMYGYHLSKHRPQTHLCDAIRKILPRMRHLRLRLDRMCGSLFINPSTETPEASLPNLKTLICKLRFLLNPSFVQVRKSTESRPRGPWTPEFICQRVGKCYIGSRTARWDRRRCSQRRKDLRVHRYAY